MTPNNAQQQVLNWLTGGLLLGGGAGLATTLIRRRSKALEDEARAAQANKDDVLYVHVPTGEKAASLLQDPAAGMAGVLGATGAYALVDAYLRKKERARLQKELEEAQRIHASDLVAEGTAAKQAGLAWGAGGTALGLMALASAIVANRALDKTFPVAKSRGPDKLRPKRIVVVPDPAEDGAEKTASIDETELLLHVALELEKGAAVGLGDVVKAAAHGKLEILEKAAADNTLFETAELHARELGEPSAVRKFAAVTWIASHPAVGAQMEALAASTVYGRTPTHCALAKSASADGLEDELRMLAVLNMQAHRRGMSEKLAKFYARVPTEKFASGISMSDMLGLALVAPEDREAEGAGMEGESSDVSNAGSEKLPVDTQGGKLTPEQRKIVQEVRNAEAHQRS